MKCICVFPDFVSMFGYIEKLIYLNDEQKYSEVRGHKKQFIRKPARVKEISIFAVIFSLNLSNHAYEAVSMIYLLGDLSVNT